MTSDALQRRAFLGSACGSLGILALAGDLGVAAETESARKLKTGPTAELKAAREKLTAELEANRGIGVPREDGQFLHLMTLATNAQKVLEIGTYRGYSGICFGTALEQTGGKLVTIDIDSERVKESRANFTKAGLADRITNLEGDGHKLAKTVEGPFDLVFLDAEKGGEIDYFNTVFPKLRPGGVILVHNAIMSKRSMQPYFDMMSKHPEIVHVILSLTMKDGFSVSLRKRG
jgi:predicted O-methyltransferase YrrM